MTEKMMQIFVCKETHKKVKMAAAISGQSMTALAEEAFANLLHDMELKNGNTNLQNQKV